MQAKPPSRESARGSTRPVQSGSITQNRFLGLCGSNLPILGRGLVGPSRTITLARPRPTEVLGQTY